MTNNVYKLDTFLLYSTGVSLVIVTRFCLFGNILQVHEELHQPGLVVHGML